LRVEGIAQKLVVVKVRAERSNAKNLFGIARAAAEFCSGFGAGLAPETVDSSYRPRQSFALKGIELTARDRMRLKPLSKKWRPGCYNIVFNGYL
jgi:hypothetical protein